MGRKCIGVKGRNVVRESSEEAPFSESAPYVLISDDDGSPLGSPSLSRTDPRSKSKTKGKQPVKPARRKTRAKNSKPKSPTPISIPKLSQVSPSVSVSRTLYSLGGRLTTPKDLERIRVKYNIPLSVRLRVPRKGKRPEHLHSDGVALHIDIFNLGLCLPLQPFFRKMFSEMQIVPGQLSLLNWRLLMGLEVLWLDVFEEDISYKDLKGLYQLKKLAGLSVGYFATWGVHGNLVRPDPLLKKSYRYGWFVAEDEWGRSIPAGNKVVHVQNFFNEDSKCLFFLLLFF